MVDQRNQSALRRRGVAVVKSVDYGKDHEQRLGHQSRHHRGELIVIAELDFGDADGVVLVNDRNGFVFEERVESVADIQITGAALEIVGRQQDLRRVVAVLPQAIVVKADQVGLSGRGRRLQMRQIGRSRAKAEQSNPGPDGTAGNDDNLPSRLADAMDLLRQLGNPIDVERVILARQDVGANLDYKRPCVGNDFFADEIVHAK